MLLGSKQMQYLDWNKYIDIIHTCLTYLALIRSIVIFELYDGIGTNL